MLQDVCHLEAMLKELAVLELKDVLMDIAEVRAQADLFVVD